MRIKHRLPALAPRSAEVSAEYQQEVDDATARAERDYRAAQQRLDSAQRKLDRLTQQRVAASAQRQHRKDVATAVALVELRRADLDRYARLMQGAPATAQHRGTRSYRPLPPSLGSRL